MKQKHKRILGIFGLGLVIATTAFAASIPAPETQATTSVTDEITVRVVGEEAGIRINGDDARTDTSPGVNVGIDYEKVSTLYVDLSYFDGNKTHEFKLAEIPASYATVDSLQIVFDLANRTYTYNGETHSLPDNFGYGEYTIHAYGYGNSEVKVITEDFYSFKYLAVVPNTGVITGQKTNLMQTDYLVTGLIIFLLVGISGFMFISGKEKNTRKRRK